MMNKLATCPSQANKTKQNKFSRQLPCRFQWRLNDVLWTTYIGVGELVTIGVDDGHDVPVQALRVLRMSGVVLHQFADQPGHESRWDPLTSVNSFKSINERPNFVLFHSSDLPPSTKMAFLPDPPEEIFIISMSRPSWLFPWLVTVTKFG